MSYRDILVQVDETPAAALRVQAAAELAARHGARLFGLFLTSDFINQRGAPESLGFLSPDAINEIMQGHQSAVGQRAEAARGLFEAAAQGAAYEWLTLGGDFDEQVLEAARNADLTVFPQAAQASLGGNRVSASQVALGSGGPVIVTPDEGYAPPIGRRVLVAWNGSREAARALRDAWPMIEAAETVHVLTVGGKGDGSRLAGRFERHGRPARLIADDGDDESAAQVIARTIAELDADLVVMGLYGRPRLQELVLGGVSRHMMAAPPVPILVSH